MLFAAVAETGSLSAAGRSMRLSPAMASKRLARLEDRLGVKLVHRTTRKLALTSAGKAFLGDVLAILDAIKTAEDRVTGSRREASGPLRVSAPTSFGRLYVAPRLFSFCESYPKVDLEINLTDAYADLVTERIDIAIRVTSQLPASLDAQRLAASSRLLCASPAYIAAHGAPAEVRELPRHRLLAAEGQLPWQLVHGSRRRTIEGTSHVRTNSSEVVRELALTGVGIALRSLWDVSDELRAGRLVQLLPGWESPGELGVYAVHLRGGRRTAAVEAFIAFLKSCFDPVPWEGTAPA